MLIAYVAIREAAMIKTDNKFRLTLIVIILSFTILSVVSCMNGSNILIDNKHSPIKPYHRSFYDSFFPIRDWTKGYDEYQSGLEPYGERGTISWPLNIYFQSEVLMYKATQDPIYLNRAIDIADRVFDLRDDKVGRINKYGESPPIWCAGSRYGYGKSILKNKNGEDVIEVFTYGTWEVDTGIVGELRTGNDTTYISVLEDVNEKTFIIKIKNEVKDFNRIYNGLTLENVGIIFDDNSVRITVLKTTDELPVFTEEENIGNVLCPHVVHTGLLLTPIIELARIIKEKNLNEYYIERADKYIKTAIEALEYHEQDWVNLNNKTGYYSGKVRENRNNITPLPWNQMFELGRVLIGLYNITGEAVYKEKVEKMINYFKEYLEYDKKNDLYIWKYWNWEGYTAIESLNYSMLDITFIYEAFKAGIGFTEEDMDRFLNTYRENIYLNNDSIANLINGKGKFNQRNWFTLSKINFLSEWGDDYFFDSPVEWIEEAENSEALDFNKLIAIARSVYQKRIIDKVFVDITDQRKIGRYRNK